MYTYTSWRLLFSYEKKPCLQFTLYICVNTPWRMPDTAIYLIDTYLNKTIATELSSFLVLISA